MNISKDSKVFKGPSEWFTGDVYVTPIGDSEDNINISAGNVHFTPGARTAWHSHPKGQLLYVTEGIGYVQSKGDEIKIVHAGDVIWTPPNELHWHGACSDTLMNHIAITGIDETGSVAEWVDHVSDEEYSTSMQ